MSEMGAMVIKIEGDLTTKEARPLMNRISEILKAGTSSTLVLNMKHVSYIDSSGLGVLIATIKALRERGGKLIICGLQSRARAGLDVLRNSTVQFQDAWPDDDEPA